MFVPGLAWVFLVAFFAVAPARAQIYPFPLDTSTAANPYTLIAGPDGALWVTQYNYNSLGRIATNGVATTGFIFTSNVGIYGVTVGPDSNFWFTEQNVDKIGRLSLGTNGTFVPGVVTEFPIHPGTNINSQPSGIVTGPDGNLWFTEYYTDLIGVMNTNGVTLHEYGGFAKPTNQLRGIAAGPDGALWFCEQTYGTIGRMTTNGQLTEIPLPGPSNSFSNCEPLSIIAGPDGAMWFTEFVSNRIGRLDVNSNYSDYVLPTFNSDQGIFNTQGPYFLTTGPDGNMWFTEYFGNNVSRITPSGFITEYPIPDQASYPTGIASGPDKNIWFCEFANSAVDEFILPSLSLTIATNGGLVLSWNDLATDYVLQGNTNLGSTNWTNIPGAPTTVVSNQFIYTNTLSGTEFYRLFLFAAP